MNELNVEHKHSERRILSDSSNYSLKAVFLCNGNSFSPLSGNERSLRIFGNYFKQVKLSVGYMWGFESD